MIAINSEIKEVNNFDVWKKMRMILVKGSSLYILWWLITLYKFKSKEDLEKLSLV